MVRDRTTDFDTRSRIVDDEDDSIAPRVWDTVRVGIDGRGARLMGAAAAIVVVVTVVGVWWNRPSTDTPVPPLPAVVSARESTDSSAATSAPSALDVDTTTPSDPAPTAVVVSVVGLVVTPGMVTLQPGGRVADALAAAGGPLPDADTLSLNLARPLADGEQIVVGAAVPDAGPIASAVITGGAAAASAPGSDGAGTGSAAANGETAGTGPAGAPVSLSRATAAELETLPGVGPVTAAAIVQWRTDNGPFSSVEQLTEVPGIGPARLAKLQPMVVP